MAQKKKDNGQEVSEKKPTIGQIAKNFEVSYKTIQRYKKDGVNIYDDEEVKLHMSKNKNQPESHQRNEIDIPGETLYEKLHNSKTLEQVKFVKAKIDSEKAAFAFEVERGNYTKNSDIKESFVRILSIFKVGLQKYESELPNKLNGLDAAQIKKVIHDSNENLLSVFQDLASEVM